MEGRQGVQQRRIFKHLVKNPLFQLILCLFLVLILMVMVAYNYLPTINREVDANVFRPRSLLVPAQDLENLKSSDLKTQIEELRRIKASVNNELRDLESKRQKLQSDISTYHTQIESYRLEQVDLEKDMENIKLTVKQLKQESDDLANRFMPVLKAPVQVVFPNSLDTERPMPSVHRDCQMFSCFDYSQCSLFSRFPVFVYKSQSSFSWGINEFIRTSVEGILYQNSYVTSDASKACVYVALLGEVSLTVDQSQIQSQLHQLPYWNGDGRNHVLLNIARTVTNFDLFQNVNTGCAIVAQSSFVETHFRENFDVVIPPSLGNDIGDVWDQLQPLSPIRRKFFLSFSGQFNDKLLSHTGERLLSDTGKSLKGDDSTALLDLEISIVQNLKEIEANSKDKVSLTFMCDNNVAMGINGEWMICGNEEQRATVLKLSTFAILISPANFSVTSTTVFQTRLYESLKNGAVPVILGDSMALPFQEVLDWNRAAVILPKARVTEMYFYIKTFSDLDVLEMKKHGRLIFETYFGTTYKNIESLLSVIRTRIHIPPLPIADASSPAVFNDTNKPLLYEGPETNEEERLEETNELLGPIEPPFPSIKFKQNFTRPLFLGMFNKPGDPFHLYPYTPNSRSLPSEAKFIGSGYGFRPVNKGQGGAGKEFSEALGGNQPREQFTVVMLTYERDTVLLSAVRRLKGLPYLNKVIVVWNNPQPPSPLLRWPDIGVPVHVIKMEKNSLNNRFLPFEAIETEAVLSIDDDTHLRHDEIVFGFRVWREERERIVGFPGRFHAWDVEHKSWLYNSNYSCELSMVLTGAAFFHKYYGYLYSHIMPQAIRDKVDEYLNCEDIAMNFLVSHITGKPPVKVTSRWTFRCPGCPTTLTNDSSHFEERHKCMNFFVEVYGYMPLLYTQYRADSVLFKTRIPHDKQKCFKLI